MGKKFYVNPPMESGEPDSVQNDFTSFSRLPILDYSEHISKNLSANYLWTHITLLFFSWVRPIE